MRSVMTPKATIKDVARAAGVSTTTVSRVLNRTRCFPAPTVARVEAAVQKLGYRPDLVARTLQGTRAGVVGCFVSLANEVFVDTVNGIESTLAARGYSVFLCQPSQALGAAEQLQRLLDRRIDGLFLIGTLADRNVVERLDARIPVVQIGQISSSKVDSIRIDNEQGAIQAVAHLVDRGCRRIAILAGGRELVSGRDRLRGYEKAVALYGLATCSELVCHDTWSIERAYQACRSLIEKGIEFDGLFATTNMAALGALRALKESHRRVPEEVRLISFADLRSFESVDPPLTVISQRGAEVGAMAAQRFLARLEAPSLLAAVETLVPPALVVRGST